MKLLTDKVLREAREGVPATLDWLDEQGLLLGPDEALDAYADRLACLARNLDELDAELAATGKVEVLAEPLARDAAIPREHFRAARGLTRGLYGFGAEWVPGFYSDYRMGLLFAGSAWFTREDFFAVFVVRRAFRDRDRWFLYQRTELLAHELCHVAHVAFPGRNYEEIFAYQTAFTAFRRELGGVLRSVTDTYLLLGSVLTLFAAQMVNIFTRPPERWNSLPMPLFWVAVAGVTAWISGRYLFYRGRFRRARANLALVFAEHAGAVLFRCAEPEIAALADLPADPQAVRDWLAARPAADPRWGVVRRRFGTG